MIYYNRFLLQPAKRLRSRHLLETAIQPAFTAAQPCKAHKLIRCSQQSTGGAVDGKRAPAQMGDNRMEMATTKKTTTRDIILCALFAALIAIGAFIRIPIPYVPITFQAFFVLLAGFLLGPKYGTISMLLYLAIGLLGLPVFTEGGGFMYVLKPTFGYLIGFALTAFVAGRCTQRIKKLSVKNLFLSGMLGMVPAYIIGTLYFYLIMNFVLQTPMALGAVLWSCVIIFLPADILRCLLAAWLAKRLLPVLRKNGTL